MEFHNSQYSESWHDLFDTGNGFTIIFECNYTYSHPYVYVKNYTDRTFTLKDDMLISTEMVYYKQ